MNKDLQKLFDKDLKVMVELTQYREKDELWISCRAFSKYSHLGGSPVTTYSHTKTEKMGIAIRRGIRDLLKEVEGQNRGFYNINDIKKQLAERKSQ